MTASTGTVTSTDRAAGTGYRRLLVAVLVRTRAFGIDFELRAHVGTALRLLPLPFPVPGAIAIGRGFAFTACAP